MFRFLKFMFITMAICQPIVWSIPMSIWAVMILTLGVSTLTLAAID